MALRFGGAGERNLLRDSEFPCGDNFHVRGLRSVARRCGVSATGGFAVSSVEAFFALIGVLVGSFALIVGGGYWLTAWIASQVEDE